MTKKQILILVVAAIAIILGAIFYVKYASIFNTLIAIATGLFGGMIGWYVRGIYDKYKR